jgi:class 3 adenylate cyclase
VAKTTEPEPRRARLGGPTLGEAETETGEWTFFIADIRGYPRFTRERGDASAARLAQSFAAAAESSRCAATR